MFGRRIALGVGSFAAVCLVLGCGGAVARGNGDGSAAAGSGDQGGSGASVAGAATAGASASGGPSSGGSAMSPGPDLRKPVDEGCTMVDLPPPQLECDPFVAGSCGPGEGCYPFVDHPEGTGCGEQQYGTVCLPAGQGKQGALCGDDVGDNCAEGFVCVVGQRAGKRCAALCKLGSTGACTGGLICGDLDVAGFGVCG